MIDCPRLKPTETLLSTIRHGLTESNRTKKVGGVHDTPLIEEGRAQARQAREIFAGTPYDVLITSPLQRAQETGLIVTGEPLVKFKIDPGCIERNFGQMEGLTRAEIERTFPEVRYLQIAHIGYSLNPPGGETFPELHARAHDFVARTLATHGCQGKHIIVFAHQNILQQIHAVLRGEDEMKALEYDIINLELNQFHLDEAGQLLDHKKVLLYPSAAKHTSF